MSAAYARPIPDAPEAATFERAHAHGQKVERALRGNEMLRAEHADVELFVEKQGREWARLMLEGQFALRGELEQRVEVVGADGTERTNVRDTQRHVESVVGRVAVPRLGYQAAGHTDLHVMDAALNLAPDHFSYGVRGLVAKEIARASFEEVVELIRDRSGAEVAKRQVEELAVRAACDFDAFYELGRDVKATRDLLVLSTDAKGIVMRHVDLREATRMAAEQKANKLETRLSPGEKADRKRMAQVCAVYSVEAWKRTPADVLHVLRDENTDDKRPRPTDKRVWASVEKHPRKVIRQAFEEALRRDPEQHRRWVVLVDGEPRQLKAVKAEAKRARVKITLVLDIVHVLEYLWLAARALFGGSTQETETWVGHRLFALLTGRSGGDVAGTIRWWAENRKDQLDGAGRKAIQKACGYLGNRTRTRLMHYADALRDGLPIATGVIEGACRYLVKDRMDRTGACWSLEGAEAVLRLRALRASGDFDEYWRFHLAREKERNHVSRYADSEIPDPLPSRKRHLRRIK
jgi:hypothetical protein